ncbi:hypothetical protein FRC00_006601, partial [Tulasnella sp. 408]
MSNSPSQAASYHAVQSTQITISEGVTSTTSATAAILRNTVWPRKSIDAAADLMRVIDNALDLKKIPKDDTQIIANDRDSLEVFLKVAKDVESKLLEASNTYGEKESNSKFGGKVKHLITSLHRDRRATVALVTDSPRTELETRPQTQHPVQTAVVSRNPLEAPTPAEGQLSNARGSQAEATSGRREWLEPARKTLTGIESISGTIPVVGSFVGAAAKIGVALISTLQTMDSNAEIAKDLQPRTSRLVDLLKRLDKKTIEHRKEDTTAYMSDLIGELKLVQERVKELDALSVMKKVFSSDEHAATLKAHQETIQATLEEIQ